MSACGKPTNTDAASAWPWVSSSMQRACSDRLKLDMGALAQHVRQHGPVAPGHHRTDLALERARHDARAHGGGMDVDVG